MAREGVHGLLPECRPGDDLEVVDTQASMAWEISRLTQPVLRVMKNSSLRLLTLRRARAPRRPSTELVKARMARRSYLVMPGTNS